MVRFVMIVNASGLEEIFRKLKRKDPALYVAVKNKIDQISWLDELTIGHFKNLRGNLKEYKRVHVGSFVLFFKLKGDVIIFDRFAHHDDAY